MVNKICCVMLLIVSQVIRVVFMNISLPIFSTNRNFLYKGENYTPYLDRGQRKSFSCLFSQLPLAQNNPQAKEACFWVAYSGNFCGKFRKAEDEFELTTEMCKRKREQYLIPLIMVSLKYFLLLLSAWDSICLYSLNGYICLLDSLGGSAQAWSLDSSLFYYIYSLHDLIEWHGFLYHHTL